MGTTQVVCFAPHEYGAATSLDQDRKSVAGWVETQGRQATWLGDHCSRDWHDNRAAAPGEPSTIGENPWGLMH